MLDENLGIYSSADYNYDGKNNAGVLSLLSRFGIGTPLIQTTQEYSRYPLAPRCNGWMEAANAEGPPIATIPTQVQFW